MFVRGTTIGCAIMSSSKSSVFKTGGVDEMDADREMVGGGVGYGINEAVSSLSESSRERLIAFVDGDPVPVPDDFDL